MTTTRRTALTAGAVALTGALGATPASGAPSSAGPGSPALNDQRFARLLETVPASAPQLEPALRAVVDIGDSIDIGPSPWGHRSMVPILGGRFTGPGQTGEGLQGIVLPGGADRQLLRSDGVKELDAVYELQTDDGTVLSVRNRVLTHTLGSDPYRRSTVTVSAPDGPYAWLNTSRFVGTLHSLKPGRKAVL
ncbi:DUF3237 domain-containing protein, partial [Micrococcus lylae]